MHAPQPSGADQRFAERVGTEVGAALVGLRARSQARGWPAPRIGRTADRAGHTLICDAIARHDPHAAIFSEEAADEVAARSAADRVWIIDPVDGTWEYQAGRPNWSIHIAVWNTSSQCFDAAAVVAPDMARLNPPARRGAMVIVRAQMGEQVEADLAACALGATIVRAPSAGAKTWMVLNGYADAYIAKSGLAEWDLAAPVGAALHAGLCCSDHAGNALTFNNASPRLPGFVIATPDVHQQVIDALHPTTNRSRGRAGRGRRGRDGPP